MQNIFNGNAPMGFGLALSQNMQAMERFSQLPPEKKQQILARGTDIKSSEEMQAFTDSIAAGTIQL